ncbi:MAG: ribosome biogenesis GTPase YlqF [Clostridiales bacterium]|nr:ribosome biogenesis GTPase YlqF [Clostridiales bacterium]
MTKARRIIEADLKLVDAVAELVDARIPISSRNPVIDSIVGNKPRIIILNKSDYADEKVTKQWRDFYKTQGVYAISCDSRSGKNVKSFVPNLKNILGDLIERRRSKGVIGKALRVMVLGIPNVGKSTFINKLAGAKKAKAEDRPGVTRGKQWVTIDKEIELLDMPGILWPKFDDQQTAMKLAFTGAIKDDILDIEGLAFHLSQFLAENYPERLMQRYKLDSISDNLLYDIGKKRGMLVSGGEVDTERAAIMLLDEFRGGKIGKISFEKPL